MERILTFLLIPSLIFSTHAINYNTNDYGNEYEESHSDLHALYDLPENSTDDYYVFSTNNPNTLLDNNVTNLATNLKVTTDHTESSTKNEKLTEEMINDYSTQSDQQTTELVNDKESTKEHLETTIPIVTNSERNTDELSEVTVKKFTEVIDNDKITSAQEILDHSTDGIEELSTDISSSSGEHSTNDVESSIENLSSTEESSTDEDKLVQSETTQSMELITVLVTEPMLSQSPNEIENEEDKTDKQVEDEYLINHDWRYYSTCVKERCRNRCNFGRKITKATGCQTCDCQINMKDPYGCVREANMCKQCPQGQISDENGCPTCECLKKPNLYENLHTNRCPSTDHCSSCYYKRLVDENGCDTCVCPLPDSIYHAVERKRNNCFSPNEIRCPRLEGGKCKYSSVLDENSCETCHCLPPTRLEISRNYLLKNVRCSHQYCRRICPFGYQTTAEGCQLCECIEREELCPKINCRSSLFECTNGYYLDGNGCQTCYCLPLRYAPYVAQQYSCLRVRENGRRNRLSTDSLVQCNAYGRYEAKQCDGRKCICVTPDGRRIKNFEAPISHKDLMHCVCARQHFVQSRMNFGSQIECDNLGNYMPVQCNRKRCRCVETKDGRKISGSYPFPLQFKKYFNCETKIYTGFYEKQIESSDNGILVNSSINLNNRKLTVCEVHREKAKKSNDIYLPICDEKTGLYKSKQCDIVKCWCVDIVKGTTIGQMIADVNAPDNLCSANYRPTPPKTYLNLPQSTVKQRLHAHYLPLFINPSYQMFPSRPNYHQGQSFKSYLEQERRREWEANRIKNNYGPDGRNRPVKIQPIRQTTLPYRRPPTTPRNSHQFPSTTADRRTTVLTHQPRTTTMAVTQNMYTVPTISRFDINNLLPEFVPRNAIKANIEEPSENELADDEEDEEEIEDDDRDPYLYDDDINSKNNDGIEDDEEKTKEENKVIVFDFTSDKIHIS
ncbi:hypothetical protein SNEBB_007674 [Seison nebaliae]|nr:hypothetical protein SNEBB_007674 [Seison nebaliae]